MTNQIEQIEQMHALVWRVRAELENEGSAFKTPDRLAALRYMTGETGEAIDINMRQRRNDARNNERDETFEDECADVLMMGFTAMGDVFLRESWERESETFYADYIDNPANSGDAAQLMDYARYEAAGAVIMSHEGYSHFTPLIESMLYTLQACPEALSRVPYRMAKIVRKHGNAPQLQGDPTQPNAMHDMVDEFMATVDTYYEKWSAIFGADVWLDGVEIEKSDGELFGTTRGAK